MHIYNNPKSLIVSLFKNFLGKAFSIRSFSLSVNYLLYKLISFRLHENVLFTPTKYYIRKKRLDPSLLYYIYSGSAGDLWFIGSILGDLLASQPNCRLLCPLSTKELVRIFLTSSLLEEYVIFIPDEDQHCINYLLSIDAHSVSSISPYHLSKTKGIIRPLHLASIPYLSQLCMSGVLDYFTSLKHVAGLPYLDKPSLPSNFNESDYIELSNLLPSLNKSPKVLLNLVNFSHDPLSTRMVILLIDHLYSNDIEVYLNTSGATVATQSHIKLISDSKPYIHNIRMPLHLMSLIMSKFDCIVGSDGGAMAIAAGFTKTPCFIVGTKSRYYPEYSLARQQNISNPYWDSFSKSVRDNKYGTVIFSYQNDLNESDFESIVHLVRQTSSSSYLD